MNQAARELLEARLGESSFIKQMCRARALTFELELLNEPSSSHMLLGSLRLASLFRSLINEQACEQAHKPTNEP